MVESLATTLCKRATNEKPPLDAQHVREVHSVVVARQAVEGVARARHAHTTAAGLEHSFIELHGPASLGTPGCVEGTGVL